MSLGLAQGLVGFCAKGLGILWPDLGANSGLVRFQVLGQHIEVMSGSGHSFPDPYNLH